jgi:hypothetical protein
MQWAVMELRLFFETERVGSGDRAETETLKNLSRDCLEPRLLSRGLPSLSVGSRKCDPLGMLANTTGLRSWINVGAIMQLTGRSLFPLIVIRVNVLSS